MSKLLHLLSSLPLFCHHQSSPKYKTTLGKAKEDQEGVGQCSEVNRAETRELSD